MVQMVFFFCLKIMPISSFLGLTNWTHLSKKVGNEVNVSDFQAHLGTEHIKHPTRGASYLR